MEPGTPLGISQAANRGEICKNTWFFPDFSSPTKFSLVFNAKSLLFEAKFLVFERKIHVFETKFLVFKGKSVVFKGKFAKFNATTPATALIQLQMKI